jgi:hypothetical protein
MDPIGAGRSRCYGFSALFVLLTVLLFWIGADCRIEDLYAPYPYHRSQVEAFLHGRLSLASSIKQIEHGLVWHNGRVEQVWGLGVAIWMVPFEFVSRAIRNAPCPDRVPFIVALALLAWYATRGGYAMAHATRSRATGIAFACLVTWFPPLWNLLLGRWSIFEDTILYACMLSIGLLIGVVRLLVYHRRVDFWIVCILAGLSGLVRVTHGVYGCFAVVLCGFVMLRAFSQTNRKNVSFRMPEIFLGVTTALVGFAFLAWSNSIRFGSPFECGHRLTNHAPDVVYLTRFGNPFVEASMFDASKELLSWLFLSPSPLHQAGYHNLVRWQAAEVRWRGVDQTTFAPSYLLLILIGCLTGAILLFRRTSHNRLRLFPSEGPLQLVTTALLLWFSTSVIALAAFYLYAPILTTRYMLDFAPSFIAPIIVALVPFFRNWQRFVIVILFAWLCYESIPLWLNRPQINQPASLSKEQLPFLPEVPGKAIPLFHGIYSIADRPNSSGIPYNGSGWNSLGAASPIVTVVIDGPQFLEVSVGPRDPLQRGQDVYRAKIGNVELPIVSRVSTPQNGHLIEKVRFQIPETIRLQNNDQLAFLCFADGWDDNERNSRRTLYEIRWK